MSKSIYIHLFAWIFFFLYEFIQVGRVIEYPHRLWSEFTLVSIRIACLMGLAYTVLYALKSRGFTTRLFWIIPIGIFICATTMLTINYLCYHPIFEPTSYSLWEYYGLGRKLPAYLVNISFDLAIVAFLFYVDKGIQEEQKRQELETHQRESELQQLRSQIQPHFLFNTLNNIHALAENESPNTSEAIFRLSNLLENSLYQQQEVWNRLDREVAYVKSYIELEKLRYGERLEVAINVFCELQHWKIPSFTLLPFVENAFKHGLSQRTSKSFLSIEINEEEACLVIKIENSLPEDYFDVHIENSLSQTEKHRGIGIENVRRRLALLYGKKYDLLIEKGEEIFLVILKLECIE